MFKGCANSERDHDDSPHENPPVDLPDLTCMNVNRPDAVPGPLGIGAYELRVMVNPDDVRGARGQSSAETDPGPHPRSKTV